MLDSWIFFPSFFSSRIFNALRGKQARRNGSKLEFSGCGGPNCNMRFLPRVGSVQVAFDGRMDAWTTGQTDRMDGWMDGQTDRQTAFPFVIPCPFRLHTALSLSLSTFFIFPNLVSSHLVSSQPGLLLSSAQLGLAELNFSRRYLIERSIGSMQRMEEARTWPLTYLVLFSFFIPLCLRACGWVVCGNVVLNPAHSSACLPFFLFSVYLSFASTFFFLLPT